MEVALWLFLNVGVALAPILVIAVALGFEKKTLNRGALLGDGFLFFFAVVIVSALISDVAKDMLQTVPKVPKDLAVGAFVGGPVLIGATLVGYFMALTRRLGAAADDGRGFAIPSLIFAGIALTLTIVVRMRVGLW